MWILFSVLCMVALVAADIIANKVVSSDELAPVMLRISAMFIAFLVGMLLYALGLGESGLAPWTLLLECPLILAIVVCVVLSEFLYLVSLRFIGMSIMEAVASIEGVVIFLGMILANKISGRLAAVQDMFDPVRLILIIVMLVSTVLLPNVELIGKGKQAPKEDLLKERRKIAIGILIALIAVIFGSGDSLLGGIILDGGEIGAIDTAMTYCFALIIPLPFFIVAYIRKRKKSGAVRGGIGRISLIYGLLFVGQMILGVLALSVDAVRSEIMFFSYPVLAITGARIFLKEHYTWRQNLCIWAIAISTILFCLIG